MVGQGDVAASTGTVDGAARARAAALAALGAAISGDPWRRRHVSRVDLVAGYDEHVPQTGALQAAAVQVPSGAGRALLQRRHRQSGSAPDSSSRTPRATATSPPASARDRGLADAAQKPQEASKAPEAPFRQRDTSLSDQ